MRLLVGAENKNAVDSKEVIDLKKYVKVVLYAYPVLRTIGEEYQIHISNKALLSYKSQKTTEELAEYLAKEIICKQRLEWLKRLLDGILDKLDTTERALLHLRYFSPCKNRKQGIERGDASVFSTIRSWSDSTYFRRQNKLAIKMESMLESVGFSEEIYEKDFAFIDVFQAVSRFLEGKGEEKIRKKERGQAID